MSDLIYPRVAVVDPTLQYSVPLSQIRHSGLDALSHVLEAYFEGLHTTEVIIEHCEAFARGIIRCLTALPEAQEHYPTRSELAFCSIYAHSGWCSIGRRARGDFASHRIGLALSGIFDIPHGVTLGIIMPSWMLYVYDQGLGHDIFARFATHVMGLAETPGTDLALAGIEAFTHFVRSLDMPVRLREVGIKEQDIAALAENSSHTLPFGCVAPMNMQAITEVLKRAL